MSGLVLLLFVFNTVETHPENERDHPQAALYCHFCHRECDPFLRGEFLRPP